MIVREIEAPLGADAEEQPSPDAWRAMAEEAFALPVPAYDGRPLPGVRSPLYRR